MPLIRLTDSDLRDARLAPFSRMTDSELRDPRQMAGLARAIDRQDQKAKRSRRCEDAEDALFAASEAISAAMASKQQKAQPATSREHRRGDPHRLDDGLFIGESKNVIERALASGIKPFALLVEERWLAPAAPLIEQLLADDAALPVFTATHNQMRELTGFERTRGALAAFHRPPLPRAEDLLAHARRVAVLEDITNYTNIGAIFRSAAALGIDAVLVTPACHDPFYRRAARVSMGTVFQVPWTRIGETDGGASHAGPVHSTAKPPADSTTRALASAFAPAHAHAMPSTPDSSRTHGEASWTATGIPLLRAHGFTTCALALSDNSIPLQDRRLQSLDKIALVLGTEGDGLATRTIAACDYTVRIPMDHDVDSLNVAAASAVAFWELRTKHRE